MNFTEHQVVQFEIFAEALNNFDYVSENIEYKFLIFILNIESLLPSSNIFEYVYKTDIHKNIKFNHQEKKKELYSNIDILNEEMVAKINELSEKISNSYNEIDNINSELSYIENNIEESEWKVDLNSHEEFTFNKIKQKLIIEKKLNYGSI
jgi:hypothetical protein